MMTSSVSSAVFWIAVIVCAVAQIGILRATRSEAAARARAATPARPAHRAATRAEELAWATLPVLALALVLALTWRAIR